MKITLKTFTEVNEPNKVKILRMTGQYITDNIWPESAKPYEGYFYATYDDNGRDQTWYVSANCSVAHTILHNILAAHNQPYKDISYLKYRDVTELDVSEFDTSKMTHLDALFSTLINLKSLDLSNFDTRNCVSMTKMFENCRNLREIKFGPNFSTKNVKNFMDMFYDCRALEEINYTFDLSNAESAPCMFSASGISKVDIINFNSSKLSNTHRMFHNCSKLKKLTLPDFTGQHVYQNSEMFAGDFDELLLPSLTCTKFNNLSGMFNNLNTKLLYTPKFMVKEYSDENNSIVADIIALIAKNSVKKTKIKKWILNYKDSDSLAVGLNNMKKINIILEDPDTKEQFVINHKKAAEPLKPPCANLTLDADDFAEFL